MRSRVSLACITCRSPHTLARVPAQAVAKAILHIRRNIRGKLDIDGVYVLSALCPFTTLSTTPLGISEREDEEVEPLEWDPDCAAWDDGTLEKTPLFAAVYTENKAVVHFLLRRRADPSGYQSQRFSEETGYQTQISPLHQCVELGRPDFVVTLLRARADPDEYGYERKSDMSS